MWGKSTRKTSAKESRDDSGAADTSQPVLDDEPAVLDDDVVLEDEVVLEFDDSDEVAEVDGRG